jgi:VanZ family protein
MKIDLHLAFDNRIFRFACLAGAVFLITSLFWLGAKPVAVGLFHPPMDKVAHFATFGLIASLLWLSVLRGKPWLVIAIVSAVGAADEFHQIFLPGRSAGLDDLAADIFAALVITSLLEFARRQEEKHMAIPPAD